MCGIVGYVGKKQVVPVIIEGLRKLEYRGYDSAGIAVAGNGEGLQIRRASKASCAIWKKLIRLNPLDGTYGIGHTRWATHGRPTEENAHPASRLHRRNRGRAQRHRRKLPLSSRSELIAKATSSPPKPIPKSSRIWWKSIFEGQSGERRALRRQTTSPACSRWR
jgi:hypothetical protein